METKNPLDQMQLRVKSPELLREQFKYAPKREGKTLEYALVHELGPMNAPPCGGVAFWYIIKPEKGQRIDPRNVVFNDGTVPIEAAPFVCDTCKAPLSVNGLEIYNRVANDAKKKARKAQKSARKRNRNAR